MREILFRGKRCRDGEWYYGNYVESNRSWNGCHPHKSWIVPSPMTNGGWFSICGAFPVIEETVGQYTGIDDKNGIKIFEGDIIKDYNGKIGYIAWLPQDCGYVIVWKKYDSRLGHRSRGGGYDHDPNLEVVGNVHDNPDLLKGGEE